MRVLAFDPGAYRMGWAVVETGPVYVASGIVGVERGPTELYQHYRLRLITHWSIVTDSFLKHKPDVVVNEIIPTRGFNDASQALLAAAALTAMQAIAVDRGYKCEQIGATTVKARIGGSNKATKVKVRNGVFEQLPELKPRLKDWRKVFDESDAIAIGLTHLGYTN